MSGRANTFFSALQNRRDRLLLGSLYLFGILFYVLQYKRITGTESTVNSISESPLHQMEGGLKWQQMNLMDPGRPFKFGDFECNLDYINSGQVAQDHPCVIDLIRSKFLYPPPPPETLYSLTDANAGTDYDTSSGQSKAAFDFLGQKAGAVFVECGALDGETGSKTLFLERSRNWTGILIEPNPNTFPLLAGRNRKSWTSPVCLSFKPYPTKMTLRDIGANETGTTANEIQCFPIYSILLAARKTHVDVFSLDVNGKELEVLKTIPWFKTEIQVLATNTQHVAEGKEAVIHFMKVNGYSQLTNSTHPLNSHEIIFVKN